MAQHQYETVAYMESLQDISNEPHGALPPLNFDANVTEVELKRAKEIHQSSLKAMALKKGEFGNQRFTRLFNLNDKNILEYQAVVRFRTNHIPRRISRQIIGITKNLILLLCSFTPMLYQG